VTARDTAEQLASMSRAITDFPDSRYPWQV
jgi:hypothetical protein